MHTILLVVIGSAITLSDNCICMRPNVVTNKLPDLESAFVDVRVTKGSQEGDRVSALKKYLHLMDEKMSTAGILRFGRSLRSASDASEHPWLQLSKLDEVEDSKDEVFARLFRELSPLQELDGREDYLRILLQDRQNRRMGGRSAISVPAFRDASQVSK